MARRDLVAIGGSAGAFLALRALLAGLPTDLPAAVLIVLHIAETRGKHVSQILDAYSPLPVHVAVDGQRLEHGKIHIAPGNVHLEIVDDGVIRLRKGPRVSGSRPSIDVLFRSAAAALGPRVVGVMLSGLDSDGASGLADIRKSGGYAIVQDPSDAAFPAMPSSALFESGADRVVAIASMAREITAALGEVDVVPPKSASIRREAKPAPLTVSCPDCGGIMQPNENDATATWKCRVGHAYSIEGLLEAQQDHIERTAWNTINLLTERADLTREVARQARDHGLGQLADRYDRIRDESERDASAIHQVLLSRVSESTD